MRLQTQRRDGGRASTWRHDNGAGPVSIRGSTASVHTYRPTHRFDLPPPVPSSKSHDDCMLVVPTSLVSDWMFSLPDELQDAAERRKVAVVGLIPFKTWQIGLVATRRWLHQ